MRPSDNYKNLLSVNRLLVDGKEYATGHADDYFVIEEWPEDPENCVIWRNRWIHTHIAAPATRLAMNTFVRIQCHLQNRYFSKRGIKCTEWA